MGRRVVGFALGFAALVLVMSCGAEDEKKKVPFSAGGSGGGSAGGTGGKQTGGTASGGRGGSANGGMSGEAGAVGAAGEAGAGGNGGEAGASDGGNGGESGMPGGGTGGGGAGGEAGNGGDPGNGGSSGSGGSAGSSGNGGSGGVDPTLCDEAGEPCCTGASCTGGNLSCAGTACACVEGIFNDYVVRPDGRLLRFTSAANQTVVTDTSTGMVITDVATVMSGQYHGCASKTDGSVWCWGTLAANANTAGQLGNGTIGGTPTNYQATRVQTGPGPTYLTDVSSLQTSSLGGYIIASTCALTDFGTVYCWGADGDGELIPTGGLSTQDEPYATQILSAPATPLTGAVQVAVGRRHACILSDTGQVWCWGSNIGGALGNASEMESVYPVRSGLLTGVTKVITGSDVSCALVGSGADAGRVFCWGSSTSGQVGIGTPMMNTDGCINFCKISPARVRVSGVEYLEGVVDIAAGYLFNCALKSDGTAWCWGQTNTPSDYATPLMAQAIPITGVSKLAIQNGSIRTLSSNGEYALTDSIRQVGTPNCGLLD